VISINNLEEISNEHVNEKDLKLEELNFEVGLAVKEAAVGKDLDVKSQPKFDSLVILK
jgi:hypothetical protein